MWTFVTGEFSPSPADNAGRGRWVVRVCGRSASGADRFPLEGAGIGRKNEPEVVVGSVDRRGRGLKER
jgi:hypothetical protein